MKQKVAKVFRHRGVDIIIHNQPPSYIESSKHEVNWEHRVIRRSDHQTCMTGMILLECLTALSPHLSSRTEVTRWELSCPAWRCGAEAWPAAPGDPDRYIEWSLQWGQSALISLTLHHHYKGEQIIRTHLTGLWTNAMKGQGFFIIKCYHSTEAWTHYSIIYATF